MVAGLPSRQINDFYPKTEKRVSDQTRILTDSLVVLSTFLRKNQRALKLSTLTLLNILVRSVRTHLKAELCTVKDVQKKFKLFDGQRKFIIPISLPMVLEERE